MPSIRHVLTRCLPALVATSVAAGDVALVTNQISEDVSIIDLISGVEDRRIAAPGKPAGVVAGRDGIFYTVSPESATVRKFDLSSGQILNETMLAGGPIGIALSHATGQVFVSDWYNARIWVLNAETLIEIDEIATGAAPAGLAVSPDQTLLASADRDADQVSIFDIASHDLRHAVGVGERPFGLAFAPDGRLFVGNVGTNDVTVIDPVLGRHLATVAVGARPYGIAFTDRRAFVTNQYADSVSVIDLETLTVTDTIDVGEYPEGIDITSDKKTVVVANWFSNTVSLIDAETLEITGEVATGDGPRAFGAFIMRRN